MFPAKSMLSVLAVLLFASWSRAVDEPSFSKEIKPLLEQYCMKCHSGDKARKGVRIESYKDLEGGRRKLIVPNKPDDSLLVKMLLGVGAKKMPPKKFKDQPSDKEVDLIKAWITAGAKDDTEPDKGEKKGSGSGQTPEEQGKDRKSGTKDG
jgi:hypothetical protein